MTVLELPLQLIPTATKSQRGSYPPELAIVVTIIIVLKMVHGLDDRPRYVVHRFSELGSLGCDVVRGCFFTFSILSLSKV